MSGLLFLFLCKESQDEESHSIFSLGDEEENSHYSSFSTSSSKCGPKGLRVFFYQLGPSLHHRHGAGLQGS